MIERERDHRVCEIRLYHYVRQPGYLGMPLSLIALPQLINSYGACVPAFFSVYLLLIRTAIEGLGAH